MPNCWLSSKVGSQAEKGDNHYMYTELAEAWKYAQLLQEDEELSCARRAQNG